MVEVTYGERLKRAFGNAIEGFADFWKGVLLFIVGSFPFLIMWGILIFVLVKIVRRSRKRRSEKRAAKEEARRKAAEAGMIGKPVSFTNPFRPIKSSRPTPPVVSAGPADSDIPEPVEQSIPTEPVYPAEQPIPAEAEQPQSPEKKGDPEE